MFQAEEGRCENNVWVQHSRSLQGAQQTVNNADIVKSVNMSSKIYTKKKKGQEQLAMHIVVNDRVDEVEDSDKYAKIIPSRVIRQP